MADRHDLLTSLPREIASDIFSRFSVELVLDCRIVCKAWRNLVLTYQQDQKHEGSDSATMSFVLFNTEAQALYYDKYHEGGQKQPIYHRRRLNLNFPVRMLSLVGSCNGLICLSRLTDYNQISKSNNGWTYDMYLKTEEPSYICNPVTREFVNLPAICIEKNKSDMGVHIIFGFGYHPLTNEYKVVRISYNGSAKGLRPSRGLVKVYTLGSGSCWRRAGETNFFLKPNYVDGSVCVNGFLHWLQHESKEIVAFDLAEEEFHLVPSPPGAAEHMFDRLCVVGNSLCLIRIPNFETFVGDYDFWVLKENNEDKSWDEARFIGIDGQQGEGCDSVLQLGLGAILNAGAKCMSYLLRVERPYKSQIWNLECRGKVYGLFSLTEGSEFLLQATNKIAHYNPSTKTTTTIWVPVNDNKSMEVPLSFINNFVSLKSLGERNVEKCYHTSTALFC